MNIYLSLLKGQIFRKLEKDFVKNCLFRMTKFYHKITLLIFQQQHLTEVGKRTMLDQIGRLQKEVKDLQYELLTVNERRELQERKYEERKMKTKGKLMRARYISNIISKKLYALLCFTSYLCGQCKKSICVWRYHVYMLFCSCVYL